MIDAATSGDPREAAAREFNIRRALLRINEAYAGSLGARAVAERMTELTNLGVTAATFSDGRMKNLLDTTMGNHARYVMMKLEDASASPRPETQPTPAQPEAKLLLTDRLKADMRAVAEAYDASNNDAQFRASLLLLKDRGISVNGALGAMQNATIRDQSGVTIDPRLLGDVAKFIG